MWDYVIANDIVVFFLSVSKKGLLVLLFSVSMQV